MIPLIKREWLSGMSARCRFGVDVEILDGQKDKFRIVLNVVRYWRGRVLLILISHDRGDEVHIYLSLHDQREVP